MMKSIQEIKEELKTAGQTELLKLIDFYAQDKRKGVQTAVAQARKQMEALEKEKQRIEAMKSFEHQYEHLG